MRYVAIGMMAVGWVSAVAWGAAAATRPAEAGGPATQPAGVAGAATRPAGVADEQYAARIIQVTGRVSHAAVDAQGVLRPWQEAQVGDRLGAGAMIRTRLRAKVMLAFGDDTVVVIERVTLASIDQFDRAGDRKRIKLGLGHGAIRAGVAETSLRSEMTIETPTATLSKRGTIGFRLEYEPVTGRFRMSLDKQGLVNALNKSTGKSRTIGPGQYVTQAMARWIETAKFDRYVPVVDTFGMTNAEKVFQAVHASGLATLEPGAGSTTLTATGRDAGRLFALLAGQRRRGVDRPLPTTGEVRPIDRPEGNFGTGGLPDPNLDRFRR